MISIFRINDPYRLIFVFLILLGFRMPYLLQETLPTIPHFHWMLIGERLADGATLYKDLYEFIGPFSAAVYYVIDFFFGRSVIVSQLLAMVLVLLQSIIFNNFLLVNKAYNEGTYVPAYCYAIVMSIHFDFMVLSPHLLALTFILLALNNIFRRIDKATKDEMFLTTGGYLGIATLFFAPSMILFLTLIAILMIYSNSLPRRLLLMAIGFFLPLSLIGCYYFLMGGFSNYVSFYLKSLWLFDKINYISSWSMITFMLFPGILTFWSLINVYWKGKFANFQMKFQQAMLLMFLGGVILVFVGPEISIYSFVFILPVMAFFIAHYLLLKSRIQAEAINLFILGGFFFTAFTSYQFTEQADKNHLMSEEDPVIVQGRKILVLGNQMHYYRNASSSTPFTNWQVSKNLFTETDYYDNLIYIWSGFQKDPPEMIIDKEGVMHNIRERIPLLKKKFRPVPNYPNTYININN